MLIINFRIWDYQGDTFVHNLARNEENFIFNLPDANEENIESNEKAIIED